MRLRPGLLCALIARAIPLFGRHQSAASHRHYQQKERSPFADVCSGSMLFYEFHLDDRIPKDHLLRRIDVFVSAALADLHQELEQHYSAIGRPSVDPELMLRMLIVGYCYGIRSERRLCEEIELRLAHRWFCRLGLEGEVPHHSTLSANRLGRFRDSDVLRHIFERVVHTAIAMGLVKGEGFAVDASVLEDNASRYHGSRPMSSTAATSSASGAP